MSTRSASPTVDSHQIMAAGLAATGAAFVTSRFGVAGTLLGAALTAMIITGGSAVLKAYIANATDKVRGGATRLRERQETRAANAAPPQDAPTQVNNPPGRSDLRDNFVGRMRAAIDWFRNLPTRARRPIVIKAALAAAVAFVICMVAIWGVEKVIGNTLSCGFWGTCSVGATPGIDPLGLNGTGAGSTLSGGRVDLGGGAGGVGGVVDSVQRGELPNRQDLVPGVGPDSSASPAPGGEAPSTASPEAEPAPASASPAAEEQRANPNAAASPAAQ